MKDYIYISDSKIDRFYQQLVSEPDQKAWSYAFGVNFGAISAKVKRQDVSAPSTQDPADKRIARLQALTSAILEKKPERWHQLTLRVENISLSNEQPTFALIGNAGNASVLITGSPVHVLGNHTAQSVPENSLSYFDFAKEQIAKELGEQGVLNNLLVRYALNPDHRTLAGLGNNEFSSVVRELCRTVKPRSMLVEGLFLEIFSDMSERHGDVFAYSPLYVSLIKND